MKLILTQRDIEEAVRNHVGNMLTMKDGTEMSISFTATRGEQGIVAEIDISYLGLTRIDAIANAPAKATEIEASKAVTEAQTSPEPETTTPAAARRGRRSTLFEATTKAEPEPVTESKQTPDVPEPSQDSLESDDEEDAPPAIEEAEQAAADEAVVPADEPKRKSLFTGFMTR